MGKLGMINSRASSKRKIEPAFSKSSSWVRAPEAGIFRPFKHIGEAATADELIGMVSDPLGQSDFEVRSVAAGIIIGQANLPVVNEGDALFHIAEVEGVRRTEDNIGKMEDELAEDPLFDEDEII